MTINRKKQQKNTRKKFRGSAIVHELLLLLPCVSLCARWLVLRKCITIPFYGISFVFLFTPLASLVASRSIGFLLVFRWCPFAHLKLLPKWTSSQCVRGPRKRVCVCPANRLCATFWGNEQWLKAVFFLSQTEQQKMSLARKINEKKN